MTDLFLIAARNQFRFKSPNGQLTTEQLFQLPLTSTTGKANLNDIAVGIADEIDKAGVRSFVASATTSPLRAELTQKLDVVRTVIEIKQSENAALAETARKKAERIRLLDAIDAAEGRELGSKSSSELRAQLAALD